jgi:glycosyltransferase involved in cell wall biosynthesis
MKLSIIIPAYNAQAYIESCLNSCCKQDLQTSEYEIIVVNDGSTDDTPKKIRPFTEKYPNIYLKNQENKGNGAARNAGVAMAKGTYIYFLDADDYIATNTLGTVIKLQEQNNLDMIIFSSVNVKDGYQTGSKHANFKIEINTILCGIDFLASHDYLPEVWRYIIKKPFYLKSGITFYDKKFVQDAFFTPTLISKTQRISYIDYDVHRYRKSLNSITRNREANHLKTHLNDMCFSVHKLHQLKNDLKEKGITNNQALQRLHVKQQNYVFIIIFRFMKSPFKTSELKNILLDFKTIEAYPLDKYMASLGNKPNLTKVLTFIFNRTYLLYPSIHIYKLLKYLSPKKSFTF